LSLVSKYYIKTLIFAGYQQKYLVNGRFVVAIAPLHLV